MPILPPPEPQGKLNFEIMPREKDKISKLIKNATEINNIKPFLLLGDGSNVTEIHSLDSSAGKTATVVSSPQSKGVTLEYDYDEELNALFNDERVDKRKIIGIGFAHPGKQHMNIGIFQALSPMAMKSEEYAAFALITGDKYSDKLPNLSRIVTAGTMSDDTRQAWTYSLQELAGQLTFSRIETNPIQLP